MDMIGSSKSLLSITESIHYVHPYNFVNWYVYWLESTPASLGQSDSGQVRKPHS